MVRRILCVDDEPNVLLALERQFRKQFEIQTAVGSELGLKAIVENGPYAVVVSDLRMPVMDGNRFLAQVRKLSPDTVRVMLTGQADLADAITAVNEGHIFQFLTKPCRLTYWAALWRSHSNNTAWLSRNARYWNRPFSAQLP